LSSMSTFSYRDAVKLMGASEHKLVTALDKVLGGVLLGGSALDVLGLLGWFDAKADFIRFSHQYAVKLSEKRSGISRYDRTQRLHAAHTMVVLASFFEALDESGVPVLSKSLDLSPDGVHPKVPVEFASMVDTPVPLVTPERPYEDNLKVLSNYYTDLTAGLASLLSGLVVWDEMDDRQRGLLVDLPAAACRRYQENIRRLAVDCPEFAFWSSLQDHQATRVVVRTALAEVERLFAAVTVGGPAQRRAELTARYRSVLDHGIIEPDQVPDGLTIPLFRDCYIDPRFQVGRPSNPAQTQSWEGVPVRADVHDFFVGYLTSPRATQSPLLVLGDPGSGKSVLTKVLAARLPATDFLPLRVELRTAPTEAELLQQVEHGLRVVLQENVSWAEFARSADGALPVVFLDGFDELLQATGVSQTGYLKKVEQFQRDNAALGRPVAIIVTSRISVADRAVLPGNSRVMRLAPFDSHQTGRWLEAWNTTNAQYFSTKLKPLPLDTAMEYPTLAEQPLLLLMLALYDADQNALQRNTGTISKAELYERLLARFADREIVKDGEERPAERLAEEIEVELERLSIVALAMFNRGVQWIAEHELDRDLAALLGDEPKRDGLREPLGAGEAVLGRFFFVQRAEAVRDEKTLRTYEFLHATFSEYLVARLTWHTLRDLLGAEKSTPRLSRGRALDDSELYGLLSFAPLTTRLPVVRFLEEMTQANPGLRNDFARMLLRVFQASQRHRTKSDYEPTDLPMPARYAVYSANIMVLATIAHGELAASVLLGPDAFIPIAWNRLALFWRSQIVGPAWVGLVDTVHVTKIGKDADRDLLLCAGHPAHAIPEPDLNWHFPVTTEGDPTLIALAWPGEASFLCDVQLDLNRHSFKPVLEDDFTWLYTVDGGRYTFAQAVLFLLVQTHAEDVWRHRMWTVLRNAHNFEDLEVQSLMPRLLRTDPDVDLVLPMFTNIGSEEMVDLAFDRMGRGGDDEALMGQEGQAFHSGEAAVDAALRMYERGDGTDLLDIQSVLLSTDMLQLAATRPDLIKRARYAAQELGWHDEIDWP
jgi:NACHT conflict system protein